MNNYYTPGPWELSRDAVPAGHVQTTIYAEATGERVAIAFECEANARLIGAAPELLAALEAAIPALIRLGDFIGNTDTGGASGQGPFDRCAILVQVRDAISKARGEDS
jgi:hypothetical protein